MMGDQRDDAQVDETLDELRTSCRVVRHAEHLADIVKQRGRPYLWVVRVIDREVEGLQHVVERVAFGVVAGILFDPGEIGEDGVQLRARSKHHDRFASRDAAQREQMSASRVICKPTPPGSSGSFFQRVPAPGGA